MAQRMSTILRPPDTSIDTQKSQKAGTLRFVPDWGDLNCDNTTNYIREYISFPPDDAELSSGLDDLDGIDGLDATPRPILTELHLDCDRYYPQQLRLAEGRLKEAAALQAPTWRKLEKDGAQLTDAERRQIFDYPDFAMILWKHRRKHDLAALVASTPVDSLFHACEQREAQERQQWLQQQQGKLLQHRMMLQQQRLQQEKEQLTVVEETISRTGGLKRPRQGPIAYPEETAANAAAIVPEAPRSTATMQPQPVHPLKKEQHASTIPKAVDNPTSIALLHETKRVPDAPAAAAGPLAAESMQQDDLLAFMSREEERIERDRKSALSWRKKNAKNSVRPHANALTREKPVVVTPAEPAPVPTVPPATITAPSTIPSHSVAKTGPKKPLLVLTPIDCTDAKTEKTAAEVREMCNTRINTGEPKRIIVVRKTGDCTAQANRSQKLRSTGPLLGTWRRSPTTKNAQQHPHLISDNRATEEGVSPKEMSVEASEQDLKAFRDCIESSAAAAAPAAPAARRPQAAAAAPAAVAANLRAFAHDHEWYSPECVWPLRNPNRVRAPVAIPPLRYPSNATAPRAKAARQGPRPAPKIARVVVAPAPAQQRRKTKIGDQFPPAYWMYDSVITRPPAKIAYNATFAKVVEKSTQEVRSTLPPKKRITAAIVKPSKRKVQENKRREIEKIKTRKVKEPKEIIPVSTPATDPDDFMDDFFDFDIIDAKSAEPTRKRSERQVSTDSYATSIDSAFFDMPDADFEQIVSEVSEEEFNAEFSRFNNLEMNCTTHS